MKSARLFLLLATLLAAAGCASREKSGRAGTAVIRFHLENAQGQGTTVVLPRSQVPLLLNPKPVLTEGDVANVELVQVELGRCLMFQLTPTAGRDFYRLSVSNQGRRLAVLIDGTALGARRIDGPIADGVIYTFVELPDDELPALVERLKASSAALQRELKRKGE